MSISARNHASAPNAQAHQARIHVSTQACEHPEHKSLWFSILLSFKGSNFTVKSNTTCFSAQMLQPRMFYLTGWSSNICSIALTLFWDKKVSFLSCMIKRRSISLSTKVNRHFYDIVKLYAIIISNVNIFTMYYTLYKTSKLLKTFNENLSK